MTNKTKLLLPVLLAAGIGLEAKASEIPTNTAQMQAMDKITGRVSVINVPVNTEVKFGSFSILVRDCRTRPPEETPENFAFVDVADTVNGNEQVNIFKGWMLSSTPALNAVEHPVYDVWLLKCIDSDNSDSQPLTPEELVLRDQLPMQRPENRAPTTEDNADNNGFDEINLSGEPIDLLPAAIREEGEESAAQAEIISLDTQAADGTAAPQPTADENAPHSLLNFSRANGEDHPDEITANIEIRENTVDKAEFFIKSDTHALSLQAENSENDDLTAADKSVTEGDNLPAIENTDTAEGAGTGNTSPEQSKVVVQPHENEVVPKVSEDILRELEAELSSQMTKD